MVWSLQSVVDGQVYMDGENVTEYTRKSIGEKVGIVQQRSVLFQGSILSLIHIS